MIGRFSPFRHFTIYLVFLVTSSIVSVIMRIWLRILTVLLFGIFFNACGEQAPATPLETYKTYTKAIKRKDTAAMKLLLSEATIKMNEEEAKSQGVTVDDIVKRETLFIESQRSVEYRDERIDGDKATLQVKNSFGSWETVPLVRENGEWKIDKLGQANQMMIDILKRQKQAFEEDGIKQNSAFDEEVVDPTPTQEMPMGE